MVGPPLGGGPAGPRGSGDAGGLSPQDSDADTEIVEWSQSSDGEIVTETQAEQEWPCKDRVQNVVSTYRPRVTITSSTLFGHEVRFDVPGSTLSTVTLKLDQGEESRERMLSVTGKDPATGLIFFEFVDVPAGYAPASARLAFADEFFVVLIPSFMSTSGYGPGSAQDDDFAASAFTTMFDRWEAEYVENGETQEMATLSQEEERVRRQEEKADAALEQLEDAAEELLESELRGSIKRYCDDDHTYSYSYDYEYAYDYKYDYDFRGLAPPARAAKRVRFAK